MATENEDDIREISKKLETIRQFSQEDFQYIKGFVDCLILKLKEDKKREESKK